MVKGLFGYTTAVAFSIVGLAICTFPVKADVLYGSKTDLEALDGMSFEECMDRAYYAVNSISESNFDQRSNGFIGNAIDGSVALQAACVRTETGSAVSIVTVFVDPAMEVGRTIHEELVDMFYQ